MVVEYEAFIYLFIILNCVPKKPKKGDLEVNESALTSVNLFDAYDSSWC